MKSKFQALALAGTAILAMSFGATSAQAAVAEAKAKATVVAAVTVEKTNDLNFGTIVPGSTAGTVTVTNGGAATCTGTGVVCMVNTANAASFDVTGAAGSSVAVTYTDSVSLTGPAGSTPMTATLNKTATPLTLAAGKTPFAFGGVLNVAASQMAGEYTTANFNVTVNYN